MIIGMMRVKNEARWIARAVGSIAPICNYVLVLDDHSTDDTARIASACGATVLPSPFAGLDETRDKDYLLEHAYALLPPDERRLGADSPHWAIMIDGDEELVACDREPLAQMMRTTVASSLSLRILYLWDSETRIRTDGIYSTFTRPSAFRMMHQDDRFRVTPYGGHLHCSSAPSGALRCRMMTSLRLLHYGYLHRDDRIRKFHWYNTVDPNNLAEDCYRHMVIGDLLPRDARTLHAGPLQVEDLCLNAAA